MRGAPQSGLARLISRISRRISGGTLGLPARRLDFKRQKERKPARWHRITVSGPTIVMASRISGAIRYKQTKIIRLKLLKTGRRGDVRRSTFSLWRRASISASSDAFERNRPRSIHLIRLSRSRIEHSSPDSDPHAKQTGFATATALLMIYAADRLFSLASRYRCMLLVLGESFSELVLCLQAGLEDMGGNITILSPRPAFQPHEGASRVARRGLVIKV